MKTQEQKQIFKEGDRVFDIRFGWGKVVRIRENDEYPVVVGFGTTKADYTSNGIYYKGDEIHPILSFTDYRVEPFSQERPTGYNDYIGKWGRFYNVKDKGKFIIGKLSMYEEHYVSIFYAEKVCNGFSYFEPLTEEQIKILGLE